MSKETGIGEFPLSFVIISYNVFCVNGISIGVS